MEAMIAIHKEVLSKRFDTYMYSQSRGSFNQSEFNQSMTKLSKSTPKEMNILKKILRTQVKKQMRVHMDDTKASSMRKFPTAGEGKA